MGEARRRREPGSQCGLRTGRLRKDQRRGHRHGDTSAAELGFKEYAGAVDYPSVTGPHNKGYVAPRQGLRQLVPLGDCALGEGHSPTGTAM